MAREATITFEQVATAADTLKAQGNNKWFEAEVQEAIDDESPLIPHAEVMQDVRAVIAKARAAKRA
ncbi:MAG: hypothetical protein R8K48_05615 [Gallionella sp.]